MKDKDYMLGAIARGMVVVAAMCTGCTTYQYAKNVKMVAFDDNVSPGQSVGPVSGESCQAFILGIPTGGAPTLDKAVADARKENNLRYMNNVSTDDSGFNAVVYRKTCVVVKGTGYR